MTKIEIRHDTTEPGKLLVFVDDERIPEDDLGSIRIDKIVHGMRGWVKWIIQIIGGKMGVRTFNVEKI